MLRDSKIKMIKSEPMTLLTFAYLPSRTYPYFIALLTFAYLHLLHCVTYLRLLTPTFITLLTFAYLPLLSLRYLPLLTYTYFIALLTLLAPTSLRYLP